jgi:indolepyruvate ferredoxin oxidoreductase, beta subunit
MIATDDLRPFTLLIAALGGEGGGVLSEWLTAAAGVEGFPVQATSIPGVAQRTGATTYYIEIFPKRWSEIDSARPLLALSPTQANVDVMVATEFLEAARAIENGWVTPDRTILIASNHRTYSILERSAMSDGRYDSDRVYNAARNRARRAVIFDMEDAARAAGSMLSPVALGAIARAAGLPIRRETFEQVIRASDIAVDSNLRGFANGFERASGVSEPAKPDGEAASPAVPERDLLARLDVEIPADARSLARHGLDRVVDYQGRAYGQLYLDRLKPVVALDNAAHMWVLTAETARFLALRMSYEDIIRVADLKTRAERTSRVRSEAGAKPDEPVVTTEFLKPGLEEMTAMLPPSIGRRLMEAAVRRNWQDKLNVGIYLRTSNVSGFLLLWTMGRLRRWRPRTWRYAEEQANIEHWLDAVCQAAQIDYQFAVETARCANLVKGYGSTHRRGTDNFGRIMEGIVWPSIRSASGRASDVARLREAALKDPEGASLEQTFSALGLTDPR